MIAGLPPLSVRYVFYCFPLDETILQTSKSETIQRVIESPMDYCLIPLYAVLQYSLLSRGVLMRMNNRYRDPVSQLFVFKILQTHLRAGLKPALKLEKEHLAYCA